MNALYLTFYTSPVVLALLAPVSAGMEWERMVARLANAGAEGSAKPKRSRRGRRGGRDGSCWDPPVTRRAEGRVLAVGVGWSATAGSSGAGTSRSWCCWGCCNAVVYNWVHNKVIAVTSATTTTVLGNVKVAMLFLFSRVLFGETKDWSWQMLGGAVVALVGFALYSGAKLRA